MFDVEADEVEHCQAYQVMQFLTWKISTLTNMFTVYLQSLLLFHILNSELWNLNYYNYTAYTTIIHASQEEESPEEGPLRIGWFNFCCIYKKKDFIN